MQQRGQQLPAAGRPQPALRLLQPKQLSDLQPQARTQVCAQVRGLGRGLMKQARRPQPALCSYLPCHAARPDWVGAAALVDFEASGHMQYMPPALVYTNRIA